MMDQHGLERNSTQISGKSLWTVIIMRFGKEDDMKTRLVDNGGFYPIIQIDAEDGYVHELRFVLDSRIIAQSKDGSVDNHSIHTLLQDIVMRCNDAQDT